MAANESGSLHESSAAEVAVEGGSRRVRKGANLRAALGATVVVFIALFPFWYGFLMEYAHFPSPPPNAFFLYLLGAPGLYIVEWLGGERISNFNVRLLLAIMAAWLFYFGVFRLYFYWKISQKRAVTPNKRLPQSESDDHT